jgi:hypothetical protein
MVRLTILAALFVAFGTSGPSGLTVTKAHIQGHDRVHIVYSSGEHWTMLKEKGCAALSDIRIAEDRVTVGWLLEIDNCCTSYSIPFTLAVRRPGLPIRRFSPGVMICAWQFREQGDRVAVYADTVHGNLNPTYELYDVRTGRKLDE